MSERQNLKRTITLFQLVGIEIGQTIGAGIFALTGIALAATGPSLFIAFLVAAVPVTIALVVMGMLGSAYPISGGTYIYGARFFSPVAAFTGVWAYVLGAIMGLFPLFALTGATFLQALFPGLPRMAVAIGLLFVFYLTNLFGTKLATSVQAVLVGILLSALLLFIGTGVPRIELAQFTPLFPGGVGGFAVAASILTFTILGANAAVELGDEIINPERNIPRSFLISIPVVTVLYVVIALIAAGAGPTAAAAAGSAGDPLSLSDIAARFLSGFPFVYFVIAGGVLAVVTTLNATYLWGTKSLIMITEDGLLPKQLARVNKRFGTPHWLLTLIFVGSVAALLIAGDRVETLAVFASIGGIIIFIPVMAAALRLKHVAPEIYDRSRLKLKGGLYVAAPVIGLLLSVVIIAILLIDLSSHKNGMAFLAVFVVWTIAGAVYAWFRLRGRDLTATRQDG
jgi:basic amino acid/polyamine antiporter, APA family